MSHSACAEADEGCGFDIKIFFMKFCWQDKGFNPVPQNGSRVNATCENKFILGNLSFCISLSYFRFIQ